MHQVSNQTGFIPHRIESIVIVREANTPNNFGQKGYLRFENVTMVRLDLLCLLCVLGGSHAKSARYTKTSSMLTY